MRKTVALLADPRYASARLTGTLDGPRSDRASLPCRYTDADPAMVLSARLGSADGHASNSHVLIASACSVRALMTMLLQSYLPKRKHCDADPALIASACLAGALPKMP